MARVWDGGGGVGTLLAVGYWLLAKLGPNGLPDGGCKCRYESVTTPELVWCALAHSQ